VIVSILASVFLVLACLFVLSGFYVVKKTSEPLIGISWIIASIIALTCWHALVAALINLVSIPVNAWSMGIADVLLGAAMWFLVRRSGSVQQYVYHLTDAIAAGGMALFAVVYFALHTGGIEFRLNYATIDPAPRLMEAIDLVNTGSVQSMFYHALTNGLLMQILGPTTTVDYYYKIFVFSDGLFLVLAGLMFYATIRHLLKTRLQLFLGIVVTALYLGAYPLNSTLYGFTYLGMGVVIICYLAFITDSYIRNELGMWVAAPLQMIGCLALVLCYSMFAPVVFIGVIAMLWMKQAWCKHLFTVETVLLSLAVFLVPVILGIVYSYAGIFTGGLTVGDAISGEGACYRDLFSNFLPFLPLAVFGVLKCIRGRAFPMPAILAMPLLVFMAGLFAMGLLGKVSAYYYYKTYNVAWFVVMYLLVVGIVKIANRETAVMMTIYGVVWALVFGLAMSGVDYRLWDRYRSFNQSTKAIFMNDIYNWNKSKLKEPGGLSPYQLALYHYVYGNYVAIGDTPVAFVGYWGDGYWYQAITNQRNSDWVVASITSPNAVMEMLKSSNSRYVVVLTDENSSVYRGNQTYLDSLKRVYSNNAGFVAELA